MSTWKVVLGLPPDADVPPVGVSNTTVESVRTSIDLLATIDRDAALVILDERLASRSGGDLVTAVRQRARGRDLPIVLLASRSRAGSVLAMARGRADAVLFEPLDLRELAYTVVRLLHRADPSPARGESPPDDAAALWAESQSEISARVTVIDAAVRALLERRLTQAVRAEARTKAHQLAGTLGVFGLATAGQHAKAIDEILVGDAPLRPEDAQRLAELAVALRDAVDTGPTDEITRPPGPTVAIVTVDLAARARLEAEARSVDLSVTSSRDDSVDGALVALAADPLLVAARGFASRGATVVVQGMRGSTVERAVVSAVPGALYLAPRADAREAVGALVEALARGRRLAGARVLLVDDDPVVHTAVRAMLEPHGARVTSLTDPLATFESLEREPPDIAVLDIDMPGLTGVELCRLIRADARWSRLVVVFCTASTDPQTIARVWAAGADDYVPKPIGPALLTRLSARLAGRSATSVAPARADGAEVDVAVVDDDVALARLVVHALEQQGLRVEHLSDGATARDRLGGPSPALRARAILLDVGLPGADGYEVLRHLAKGPGRPRVIMLTARSAEPEVVRALELGAFDHVAKPFSVPVLVHRVRRALDTA